MMKQRRLAHALWCINVPQVISVATGYRSCHFAVLRDEVPEQVELPQHIVVGAPTMPPDAQDVASTGRRDEIRVVKASAKQLTGDAFEAVSARYFVSQR